MKIGVDIMGGDFAPEATIKGVILAQKEFGNECSIVLFGAEDEIKNQLVAEGADPNSFEIVHAPDVIKMAQSPVRSFAEKPNSTIAQGYDYLRDGKIDGFASAGNTGAMLVGAVLKLGACREDIRPCLITTLPRLDDSRDGIMLDVGAIADTKPETLLDLGVLGVTFAREILKIDNPRVGLLNIGEEPEKGNMTTIAGHKLLAAREDINFIGNIEGRELFDPKTDVVVTGGFTGNILVKLSEKFYEIAYRKGQKDDPFYKKFNYEIYGGSPILGVNKPAVVGHGISSPLAIKNMIRLTKEMVQNNLSEKIKEALQHV